MSAAADLHLIRRLTSLYGRAFVVRLIAAGEEAKREGAREMDGYPPEEIVVRVRLDRGLAVRHTVERWHPTHAAERSPVTKVLDAEDQPGVV